MMALAHGTSQVAGVVLVMAAAVGLVGCSETRTKTTESLVADRLKRCERLNLEVSAKHILKDIREGGNGAQYQQDLCRPAQGVDAMDHLHRTLMALAASYPETGTCSIHGPFIICEAEGELFPLLRQLTGREGRRATHHVLYRVERPAGWQTMLVPSDSALLAEWSRQIRLLPDSTGQPEPKASR